MAFNGANNDFLTLKYDPSGNPVNSWSYDQGGSEQAYAIAIDGNDNFYVAGRDGNLSWLTIKYAPSGEIIWKRTFNAPSVSFVEDMAVDSSGSVFVTGYRESGNVHSWVTVKYDAAGNLSWSRVYNPGSDDLAHGVAVDNNGGAYVAGSYNYSTAGKWFIVKYDASGNIVWSKTNGSAWYDQAFGVTSDGSGNIYACGYDSGVSRGVTIIKYDPSGAQLWKDTFPIDTSGCKSITVDRGGSILASSIANFNGQDNFLTAKYWQNLPLNVTTSSLASGATGSFYGQTLSASGGVKPYAWALASGSLPAGLSLSSLTGSISGTPLSAGTYSFTAQVTDAASSTATRPLSITINSVSFIITALTGSHGAISPSGAVPVTAGQSMTFFITPDPGYHVASVSGCGGTLVGSTYTTGPITEACTVSATFVPIIWTLSTSVSGSGTVHTSPGTDLACTSNCSMSYEEGTIVTLSTTPGTGQMFTGWSGACSGTGTCQVTMNASKSVTATFNAITPVAGVTLSASPASPQLVNTPVTFTAVASGGSITREYQFAVKDPVSGVMKVKQHYGSSNTFSYTPTNAGTYTIRVFARNVGSTALYEAARWYNYAVIATPPVSSVTLGASPGSPQLVGTPVTFTATATGGSSTREYQFAVNDPASGVMTVKQPYGSSNTFPYTPTTPGAYSIRVYVRNAGSAAQYEAVTWYVYNAVTNPPVAGVTLGASPASPQPVNTPVTFTATATGGGASKEYQFAVKDPVSGVMTVKQSYGSSNTFPYTPVNAGTYTIRVYVRNVGSAASYEAARWLTFTVTP